MEKKEKSLVSKLSELEGRRALEKRLLARMSAPSALKAPAKIPRGPAAREAAARRAEAHKRPSGGSSSIPARRSMGSNLSQPSGSSKERKAVPPTRDPPFTQPNKPAPVRDRPSSQKSSGGGLLYPPRSPRGKSDKTSEEIPKAYYGSSPTQKGDWNPRSNLQPSSKPNVSPNRVAQRRDSVEQRRESVEQIEDQLSAMEQKLRERAELNKLKEEKEELQQKLEDAWALQASTKEVMETECITLSNRLSELEEKLGDVTAERDQLASQAGHKDQLADQLASQLAELEASRVEWDEQMRLLKEELSHVIDERDILKEEVETGLLKQHQMEQRLTQAQEERELLEEELVILMEAAADAGSDHIISERPPPSVASIPESVPVVQAPIVTPVSPELEEGELMDLAENILDKLKHDMLVIPEDASSLVGSVLSLQPAIAEVSTSEWAEVNVCGDLGANLELLWQILDLNGDPEQDNQYIFNCGNPSDDDDGIVMLALCALKVLYPDWVHLLSQCDHIGDARGIPSDGLSLGAVVNREVLVMHRTLFDQTANAHNVMSPGGSPRPDVMSSSLIPEPIDTNSDPVFLQQLKGLEETTDATVAQIRVTPGHMLTPDNARFLMFRSSRLFKCIDYFESDDDEVDLEPEDSSRWAQPRSSRVQQPSGLQVPGAQRSHTAIPKTKPKREVSQAPNLAYNAGARERQRKNQETSRLYGMKNETKPSGMKSKLQKPSSARWN